MLYFAVYVPSDSPPPDPSIVEQPILKRYYAGWGREGDHAVFAQHDENIAAGACWIRLFPPHAPGYGFVDAETPELSIAVAPTFRGRGLGTRLLKNLLEWIRVDFHQVSLSVSRDNPAVRLYERAGFRIIQQDETSQIMVKILQKPEIF
jgi:ribosomal protein S18 acetylase RimI-like enzyme